MVAAAAAPTTARWVIPNLLTAALLAAVALFLIVSTSVKPSPPPSLDILLISSSSSSAPPPQQNRLSIYVPPPAAESTTNWISAPPTSNFTSTLLSRWLAPGGEPCRDSLTTAISFAPPLATRSSGILHLSAGAAHEFSFQALDEHGRPRCLGGDYFEADLSGDSWKSRPPLVDHGNGSYSLKLQVHPDFSGAYTLTLVLLFRRFEGLKFSPERFRFRKELARLAVAFRRDDNVGPLPPFDTCGSSSFRSRDLWSGRWTRHGNNPGCAIDDDGRYRCLPSDFPCRRPWCSGPLGSLESNGWVYSAHCGFRILDQGSAWECLAGRWLFFWGDSNHVDTIRNMLNFALGLGDVASVPRRFDRVFTNPRNGSQSVRITSVYNGHWNDTQNYLGLESLRSGYFRGILWKYFAGEGEEERVPDVVILNSGLHDGVHWRSVRAFARAAEYAAGFWEGVVAHVRRRRGPAAVPRIFYRTTIATGGYARDLAFNPSKMEAFNGVLLEKLKEKGVVTGGVVDEFDMTFPWHYDNRCNDGVHYGRAPAKARWRDGEVGHQYFVDLMLVHVLLNAVCNE